MPARVVTVAIILMLLGRPTRAALTAFWRNNPITPQAIADDPTLASMQSWSVMVSNTEGMWTSAGLRATLPHPTRFYRNPIGGPSRPSTAEQAAHPALTFHTYVTQPIQAPNGLSPPTVLGGFPDAKEPASFGGSADVLPGIVSVAWGDPTGSPHPPGIFEVARLTFPQVTLPSVHPESFTAQLNPAQLAPIPTTIPETGVSGIGGIAILAMFAARLHGLKKGSS